MLFKKENVLDFACNSCGSCCKHFNINITHLDIERILVHRPDLKVLDFVDFSYSEDKDDNESFISTYGKRQITLKHEANSKGCVFLKDNMCSIHTFKPLVCRVWPFSYDKGKISWIQEHKSFIKKVCQHSMVPGSNNKEELIVQIKQHYKERNIFAKVVQKWNEQQKKNLKEGETFSNILDQDFLDFILQEIEITKSAEKEVLQEEEFLNLIITELVKDRKIEAILESKVRNLNLTNRINDLNLNIYLQEQNMDLFFSTAHLKELKLKFEADIFIENYQEQNKKVIFLVKDKILALSLYPFTDLYKVLPYDTREIYNPYKLELKIQNFEEQKRLELERLYKSFWFKVYKAFNSIINKDLLAAKDLITSMINIELYSLIFLLNKKLFALQDIPILKYKKDDLYPFFTSFINSELKTSEEYLKELVKVFENNWELTTLIIEDAFIAKTKKLFEKVGD